jgi:hypothetical protein
MRLRRYFVLLVFLMVGCSMFARKYYEPPKEGPTAKLTFATDSVLTLFPSMYEQSKNCKGKRMLGHIGLNQNVDVLVKADDHVSFLFIGGNGPLTCRANLRFKPSPGGEYKFEATMVNSKCFWKITRNDVGVSSQDVPVWELKFNELALTDESEWCFD